jgi:hypothetical protein
VRGQSDIGDRLLDREVVQPQLQNADRLTPAGHRREHASAAILDDHLDGLGGERPAPCGVPTKGTCSAVSFPCKRSAPSPPE